MEIVLFPGNEVVNLFPHWVNSEEEIKQLIPLNAHGIIINSNFDNGLVTVQWEIPEQRDSSYTVQTERTKSQVDLAD